ncbi:hypothetical protein FACS1894167_05260 [Synergistales bacterium]|nr:hypothetical protein FACS1894167_05260 [Synergistales bacterium]
MKFDRVVIAMDNKTRKGVENIFAVKHQLLEHGVPDTKILLIPDPDMLTEAVILRYPRIQFLQNFSSTITDDIEGSVAECGVCWGDFAARINECFPKRKMYLFDTFENFPSSDLSLESTELQSELRKVGSYISETVSPELALLKCPHKENVIIRKGYVPDTLYEFGNECFVFVNLDMDTYVSTISALRFFADKMVVNGVILVHDYFGGYDGVTKAVDEFAKEVPLKKLPAGDGSAVAITII